MPKTTATHERQRSRPRMQVCASSLSCAFVLACIIYIYIYLSLSIYIYVYCRITADPNLDAEWRRPCTTGLFMEDRGRTLVSSSRIAALGIAEGGTIYHDFLSMAFSWRPFCIDVHRCFQALHSCFGNRGAWRNTWKPFCRQSRCAPTARLCSESRTLAQYILRVCTDVNYFQVPVCNPFHGFLAASSPS